MEIEEFREIPGYEGYAVNRHGKIKSIERDIVLSRVVLDGYFIVSLYRGAATRTLPVHRAVALVWVENPDPSSFNVVNHKDGNRKNNYYGNLEWTSYSGNNYHAVDTGLRTDNIPCMVRDFETGFVTGFMSVAQAAEFVGLRKDSPITQLAVKKFGKLINGRYEFRYEGDETPWFYEGRKEKVGPSRFMVVVKRPDGTRHEFFSRKALLKAYQLYRYPETSMQKTVEYARSKYPDHVFELRDSYTESKYRARRKGEASIRIPIVAKKAEKVFEYRSLTQCARAFNVDRSVIQTRLERRTDLDGWTFTQQCQDSP